MSLFSNNERVMQQLVYIGSIQWIYHKALIKEWFEIGRNMKWIGRRTFCFSYHIHCHKFVWTVSIWRLASKHFYDCATNGPNVSMPSMTFSFDNFRSHPIRWSLKWFPSGVSYKDSFTFSKICKLANTLLYQNICSFNISMGYFLGVQIFKSFQNLVWKFSHKIFIKRSKLLQVVS